MKNKYLLFLVLLMSFPFWLSATPWMCRDTFTGNNPEHFTGDNPDNTNFRRTYPKTKVFQSHNRSNKRNQGTSAKNSDSDNNNQFTITRQDFENHFAPGLTKTSQATTVSPVPMDVKDNANGHIWEVPNFANYNGISQQVEHPELSNTEGYDQNFILATHAFYYPATGEYHFYVVDEVEVALTGTTYLTSAGTFTSEGYSAISPSEITENYSHESDSGVFPFEYYDHPTISEVSFNQQFDIIATGTLSTPEGENVPAFKIHRIETSTTTNLDGSVIIEKIYQIMWYSKDGHMLTGYLPTPEDEETYEFPEGDTEFTQMFYTRINTSILSVEWTDFFAKVTEKQQVALNWHTATEQDNSYFNIEKSIDGKTFTKIGEQVSKGNSTEMQAYDFTDKTPATGTNYYRIEQIDHNGKSTFSEVITAIILDDSETNPTVVLYPNPGKNEVWFSQPADYELFDSKGTLLTSGQADGVVDVSGLPAGAYFVRINGGEMQAWLKN